MPPSQADIDNAVLKLALEWHLISAADAKSIRSDYPQQGAPQPGQNLAHWMVAQGMISQQHAQQMLSQITARATRSVPAKPAKSRVAPRPQELEPFSAVGVTLIPDAGKTPSALFAVSADDIDEFEEVTSTEQLSGAALAPLDDGPAGFTPIVEELPADEEPTYRAAVPAPGAGADRRMPSKPVPPRPTRPVSDPPAPPQGRATRPVSDPPAPPQGRATRPVSDPPAAPQRPTRPVSDPPAAPQRPTRPVSDPPAPPQGRATRQVPEEPQPAAERRTRHVPDGDPAAGRPTVKRETQQWTIANDELASTEKIVPAGTVIQMSALTVAQVRNQMGIGDGIKLISNKMQSTVAHLQPDAGAERKRYVVIRELARGGMGKVLEVEDTELRRSVALKVLRKELLSRPDIVERFLEEAQITGQLEHPHIVPVHEMGVDGAGNLYFTMKLVEGHALSEVLLKLREGNRDTRRDFPQARLLDAFIKICEGLAFAHNRGVIHRDLKPANIMVGKFGEVQVMDWGVAKIIGGGSRRRTDKVVVTDRLEGGSSNTVVGAVIGTPSYMSPEQAHGDIERMGPASDIFSLGVILYEMLALRSPWTGRSSDEVLEQVKSVNPILPSKRNPEAHIPAELERLCMRCLAKDPEERVETVQELADNVRSYMEGRTLGAVEYSLFRLAMKWVGRHRKEVVGILLMLALLAGGIVGTSMYLDYQENLSIAGEADNGRMLLSQWPAEAEQKNFDKAVEILDQARAKFRLVLTVKENDPEATQGLADIDAAQQTVRSMRLQHLASVQAEQRISRLLQDAAADLEAARGQEHYLMARTPMWEALAAVDAVLIEHEKHERALALKAEITEYFARRAMVEGKDYSLAEQMVKLLRDAGGAAVAEKLDSELRRLRGSGN